MRSKLDIYVLITFVVFINDFRANY